MEEPEAFAASILPAVKAALDRRADLEAIEATALLTSVGWRWSASLSKELVRSVREGFWDLAKLREVLRECCDWQDRASPGKVSAYTASIAWRHLRESGARSVRSDAG